MKRIVLVAVAALAVAGPASAAVRIGGLDTSSYPTLRVNIEEPVGSPAPVIRENGRPVVGMSAVNLGREKSVVLAVDRSQSMAGKSLADARAAARAFVSLKQPNDRLEVVAFGRQAVALSRFSTSALDANSAIGAMTTDAHSGTALWDAIVLAAKGLESQDQEGHVIIVLTDGHDVSSTADAVEAIRAANDAHASVYAIGIAGPDFTPGPLESLAAQTGGVFREASSTAQLSAVYKDISDQLARTWQVQYISAARPGDKVTLAASVPGNGTDTRKLFVSARGPIAMPASPSVLSRSAWRSPLAPLAVAGLVGLLVLFAAGFVAASRSGVWLSARLEPHLGASERRRGRRRARGRGGMRQVFVSTERVFGNVKQFRSLQRLITRADMPLLAAEMLYICLGTAVVLGLFFAVTGLSPMLIVVFMFVGGMLPIFFVFFKASARVKAFDNQLPDLLITIAASLKAGHSFRHAIQAVVDEGIEPATTEFRRVLTETQLGKAMDVALADMGERLGSKQLTFVLTAVTIQRQIGGSLAGLFDMVAETVRHRQQFARKIKGLTAMGRMSAYVLAGLPFFLALALTLINPTYMAPLWSTSLGHTLIVVSLVMIGFGALVLKQIVSFKG